MVLNNGAKFWLTLVALRKVIEVQTGAVAIRELFSVYLKKNKSS